MTESGQRAGWTLYRPDGDDDQDLLFVTVEQVIAHLAAAQESGVAELAMALHSWRMDGAL